MIDPAAQSNQVGGRNLPVATAVGVALAVIFLASLFAGPLAFAVVISITIALGVWESSTELGKAGLKVDARAAVLGSTAILWLAYRDGTDGQATGVAIAFALAVAVQLLDRNRQDVLRRLAVTLFLSVWLGLLASYAVLLRARPEGDIAALAVIGAAIFTDIGGFAFGVKFGKTKLAPKVSPNKSLEGLLGGLFVAAALAALVLPQVSDLFNVRSAIAMALLAGGGGFLGDLTESMIKRDMGIKDLGSHIPGHGGVLDRVDGILLALPLGYFAIDLLL
ncbi:MAG: phosphatidate cytidylyltransferase [Glaciecola sp.]